MKKILYAPLLLALVVLIGCTAPPASDAASNPDSVSGITDAELSGFDSGLTEIENGFSDLDAIESDSEPLSNSDFQ